MLVPADSSRCACGGRLRRDVVRQDALLRGGGYGGTRRVETDVCEACAEVRTVTVGTERPPRHQRGVYGMVCWNGLSAAQRQRLIKVGNLPINYQPEGVCTNGAEVEIVTVWDEAPGPRFYCLSCAVDYLARFSPP